MGDIPGGKEWGCGGKNDGGCVAALTPEPGNAGLLNSARPAAAAAATGFIPGNPGKRPEDAPLVKRCAIRIFSISPSCIRFDLALLF